MHQSVKVYDGFSVCFRQWRAEGTHCKFLHGYGVSFEVTFSGSLDERGWIADFGLMKRAKEKIDGMNPADWMKYMFDHTVIVAEDDPHLVMFQGMDLQGIIQLRVLRNVGAERFAEYICDKLNTFVMLETDGRVRVTKVVFKEHDKNSAVYE